MECAELDRQFLSAACSLPAQLPVEAQAVLSQPCLAANDVYLDTLSRLALHPVFSSTVLTHYEPLLPELVARWPSFATAAQMAAGTARILPVVPHLVELAEHLLLSGLGEQAFLAMALGLADGAAREDVWSLPAGLVLETLLSLNRLLCFRRDAFLPLVDPTNLYRLLGHPHRAVRYVAIRVLCIYLKAADSAQEEMLESYGVGRRSEKVLGPWEGREVDYGFLMWLSLRPENAGCRLTGVLQVSRSLSIQKNGGGSGDGQDEPSNSSGTQNKRLQNDKSCRPVSHDC